MFKEIVKGSVIIPDSGKKDFEFKSTTTKHEFRVSIFRNSIGNKTCYNGLLKGENIVLLRLDITEHGIHKNPDGIHKNPDGIHKNPDGSFVYGNHLHVFTEEYGSKYAINFNVDEYDVVENCLAFFKEFNIINTALQEQKKKFN